MDAIEQKFILIPVSLLALWTLLVLLMIAIKRFDSIFNGQCGLKDFKNGESDQVPVQVSIVNRNYMNLLEAPVLFYMAAVLFYISEGVTLLVLSLCGLYVLLRILHSLVHITYNNVMHRFVLFASSNVVLLCIWLVWLVYLMSDRL